MMPRMVTGSGSSKVQRRCGQRRQNRTPFGARIHNILHSPSGAPVFASNLREISSNTSESFLVIVGVVLGIGARVWRRGGDTQSSIRSFAGLASQQPTQMAIISLKSLLGDLSPEEPLFHMRAGTRMSCQLD